MIIIKYHDFIFVFYMCFSDGIFGSREKNDSSVHISILNELLQAMDGANVQATSLQGASQLTNSCTSDQVCAHFIRFNIYFEAGHINVGKNKDRIVF